MLPIPAKFMTFVTIPGITKTLIVTVPSTVYKQMSSCRQWSHQYVQHVTGDCIMAVYYHYYQIWSVDKDVQYCV